MEFNVKTISYGLMTVVAIVVLTMSSQLFEINHAGYVQVKQAATSGEMTVRIDPGMYAQMFGSIHEYKISDVYDFHDKDEQISVRFNDAATAQISGQIKYRLPMQTPDILKIHQDFRSDAAVHSDLIRQVVAAALKQTATLFGAEEVYSTRRSDFIYLVNEQIKNGIFATTYTEDVKKDENGDAFIRRVMAIKNNVKGEPIVAEESAFKRYGIELVQLVINDVVFDDKTNELIAERKKADQQKVVARANAERAKQDAITAEEVGKANVAEAEAKALVEKKTAVVAAQKEKEVAEQKALQAEQEKKATIARGEADAMAAKLKVAAGLSPLERATIDKETAIGVAGELAKVKLPQLMIIGSDGKGGSANPFDAVGLESFIRISKGMASQESTNANQNPK